MKGNNKISDINLSTNYPHLTFNCCQKQLLPTWETLDNFGLQQCPRVVTYQYAEYPIIFKVLLTIDICIVDIAMLPAASD